MNSYMDLKARLDPKYQLQLEKLRHEANMRYNLASYEAEQSMSREHVRGGYELEKQKIRNEGENYRQEREISAMVSLEGERYRNNVELASIEQKNKIVLMEEELKNHMNKAQIDFSFFVANSVISESASRRESLMKQIEARSNLRGEVFKMLAGAVIQEKLAQRQHARDMEKVERESENRRADVYMQNLSVYLLSLMDKGRNEEVKTEIDRLVSSWNEMYKC